MHVSLSRPWAAVLCAAAMAPAVLTAQTAGTALVRHAPSLNGTVEGSVQQMTAESVTLNSGANVTGDLLVPGEPTVRLNGKPSFGGAVAGQGAATPTDYSVTLNGNVQLRNLRTRTDAAPLPAVAPAPSPAGTRSVTLNSKTDVVGDFATVRNLTANGNVGQIVVPPGAYGDFTANGNSGFSLGVAGSTQPAVYSFQHLTLNGNGALQVVGPVVITIANGVAANGTIGSSAHPEWLSLRIANGGVTLNAGVAISGYVLAPAGAVVINGNSQLIGGVECDRLTLNGNGQLRLINAPPAVAVTAPASGFVATAPIASLTLAATATDADGYLTKVEFFSGTTKLAECAAPPFQISWTAIPAGTYAITAKATDNSGAVTTSAPLTVVANQPPLVSLIAPTGGTVLAPPAQITLSATATDLDGTIARVAFYVNDAKIGESATAPFQFTISGLALGSYKLFARATDNYGATADSGIRSVVVETPPTATISAPATVSRGAGVALTASASDADGSVAKVEFYRGTKLIGTVTTPTGTPPVFVFTDAEALAPGTYAYTARSYDNLGLFTDSTVSTVAVLATLPYLADFEASEGYTVGPIDKQLGWAASGNGAAVTDQGASNGVRSIALAPGTPPVRVAQTFAPFPGLDVVFIDFFARPVAQTDVTASTTFDVEGARFAFAQTGANAVLNAFDGDGAGAGSWRTTSFSAPIGADAQLQAWVRLTARLDFAHKTWDLYAAGNMVAADLKFRDGSTTYLSSFAVRGDAATVSRLDYIFAGADNPLFADTNNNGIDDAWETAHGLLLTTAGNRDLDPDLDGASTVREYARGTDPSDYYNGNLPTIVSLVAAEGRVGADGAVAVRVTGADGSPLVSAPVSFEVKSGPSRLATSSAGPSLQIANVRTDARGSATVYVAFNGASEAPILVSARSASAATTILVYVTPFVVDNDHNGLPDDWEVKYFGHLGVDPGGDDDGDGLSNLQEYRQGTDPTDYYNGVLPQLTSLVDGSAELDADGALAVRVTNSAGAPLENAPATFRALVGGHLLSATPDGPRATEVKVRTDAQGIARAYIQPEAN